MFIYACISRLCSVHQLVYLDVNITSFIISLKSGSLRTLCCYFWYSRSFAIPYSTKKGNKKPTRIAHTESIDKFRNLGIHFINTNSTDLWTLCYCKCYFLYCQFLVVAVYRNAVEFYILILFPVTVINSHHSNSFYLEIPDDFLHKWSWHLWIKSFISFPIWFLLFFLSDSSGWNLWYLVE